MIHAQVDVELRDHERITGADLSHIPEQWQPVMREAMMGLYVDCLLYGQAKRLSAEGRIPQATVHGFKNGGQQVVAAELVRVGMLVPDGRDYLVHNYGKKNRSGEQIEAAIEANRKRQEAYRAKRPSSQPPPPDVTHPPDGGGDGGVTRYQRVAPGSGSSSGSGSDLKEGVQGGREPEAPSGPRPYGGPPSKSELEYRGAYVRGIERAKGSGFVFPERQQGDLNRAIVAHGRKRDGTPIRAPDLFGWIEDAAADFVNDLHDRREKTGKDEVTFYSSFAPRGFAKWLNEQSTRRVQAEDLGRQSGHIRIPKGAA